MAKVSPDIEQGMTSTTTVTEKKETSVSVHIGTEKSLKNISCYMTVISIQLSITILCLFLCIVCLMTIGYEMDGSFKETTSQLHNITVTLERMYNLRN